MLFKVTRFGPIPGGGRGPAQGLPVAGGVSAGAQPEVREIPAPPPRPVKSARSVSPADIEAKEKICRGCVWLDDEHCTHPGCPSCFRHPLLRGPWKNRRCPANLWPN